MSGTTVRLDTLARAFNNKRAPLMGSDFRVSWIGMMVNVRDLPRPIDRYLTGGNRVADCVIPFCTPDEFYEACPGLLFGQDDPMAEAVAVTLNWWSDGTTAVSDHEKEYHAFSHVKVILTKLAYQVGDPPVSSEVFLAQVPDRRLELLVLSLLVVCGAW